MNKFIILIIFSLFIISCKNNNKSSLDLYFSKLNILTIKKNVILSNIQNTNTTRTEAGGPYIPVEAIDCNSVSCKIVALKQRGLGSNESIDRSFILKYEPGHPDSNKTGYVKYPDINIIEEQRKLKRIEIALSFLLKELPVSHSFFFSNESQSLFKKYPSLDSEYNFKKLLEE